MTRTVQIRGIDDEVYAGLQRHAAELGVSVPELLRRQAERLAARPSMAAWLERTRRRQSAVSAADVVEALDEVRGAWPVVVPG